MKTPIPPLRSLVLWCALAGSIVGAHAQVTVQQLTNGLVDYWPLDTLNAGGQSTPDVVGNRDLLVSSAVTFANIVPATRPGLVPGVSHNCFNLNQSPGATVLYYVSKG